MNLFEDDENDEKKTKKHPKIITKKGEHKSDHPKKENTHPEVTNVKIDTNKDKHTHVNVNTQVSNPDQPKVYNNLFEDEINLNRVMQLNSRYIKYIQVFI